VKNARSRKIILSASVYVPKTIARGVRVSNFPKHH
jgi:hypothetical protein